MEKYFYTRTDYTNNSTIQKIQMDSNRIQFWCFFIISAKNNIKPNININIHNEQPFRDVCNNGYLELAKFLYQFNPNIDISAQNEQLFRYACEKGHLELAQWLLQIKPEIDISVCNEQAFRNACYSGNLEIAK